MNIRALKFFVAVVNQKSFVKAASLLCVTQSAISKSIKTLEAELNCTLLIRTNNIVVETEAGHTLYCHASNILNELNSLKINLNDINAKESRKLTLGLPASSPGLFFATVNRYIKQYPRVIVTVIDKCSHQLEQMIINNQLNIAVVPLPLYHPELTVVTQCPERLVLVSASDRQPITSRDPLTAPVPHLDFITLTDDHRLTQYIQMLLKTQGWDPGRILETNSIEQIFSLVAHSPFVALVPESLAMQWHNNPIVCHSLAGEHYTYQTGVVVKPGRALTAEETQFLQMINQALADGTANQDSSS